MSPSVLPTASAVSLSVLPTALCRVAQRVTAALAGHAGRIASLAGASALAGGGDREKAVPRTGTGAAGSMREARESGTRPGMMAARRCSVAELGVRLPAAGLQE